MLVLSADARRAGAARARRGAARPAAGSAHRSPRPPGLRRWAARARGHPPRERAPHPPRPPPRAGARPVGRPSGSCPHPRRGRPGERVARPQPLRRPPGADAGDAPRSRRPRRRPAGRRLALLHLRVDDRPGHAGLRDGTGARHRPRPPESAGRRADGGQRGRSGLRVLRRALSPGHPPRHDDRRAGALPERGARPRLRPDRRPHAGLAALDALGGDGAPVGAAVAQHAHARHGAGLSGRLPHRGHEPLGGTGHDAALRVGRGALPRRRTRTRRRSRPCACPVSASGRRASGRRSRSGRDRRAAASSFT